MYFPGFASSSFLVSQMAGRCNVNPYADMSVSEECTQVLTRILQRWMRPCFLTCTACEGDDDADTFFIHNTVTEDCRYGHTHCRERPAVPVAMDEDDSRLCCERKKARGQRSDAKTVCSSCSCVLSVLQDTHKSLSLFLKHLMCDQGSY